MPALKLKTRICPGCKKIEQDSSRNLVNIFCSRGCWIKNSAGQHFKTGKILQCDNCTKDFYARGSFLLRGIKYCSQACYQNTRAKQKSVCPTCLIEFEHNRGIIFCSHSCSKTGNLNPNWKGGVSVRLTNSVTYQEWRTAVFKRDRFCCKKCGEGGRLHAHHKYNYSDFPHLRFEVSNGVALCVPCHRRFHFLFGRRSPVAGG